MTRKTYKQGVIDSVNAMKELLWSEIKDIEVIMQSNNLTKLEKVKYQLLKDQTERILLKVKAK